MLIVDTAAVVITVVVTAAYLLTYRRVHASMDGTVPAHDINNRNVESCMSPRASGPENCVMYVLL